MATVVWHGFQYSSSEAELPVTSLLLKLAHPQKPTDHVGGWKFLQKPTSVNPTGPEGKKDGFAPLTPSLLKLSEKSLEMCTEKLGSETGSDVISDDADVYPTTFRKTRQQSLGVKKVNWSGRSSFPPPLTTRRGGVVVVVRRHREEGRVVMDAVKCPFSTRSNFITDRSNGRLRLTLLRPVPAADSDEVVVVDPQLIQTAVVNNESEISRLDIITGDGDEDEGEKVSESTGRFQKQQLLPGISSRCMEVEGDYPHHTRQFINVRLWVAAS